MPTTTTQAAEWLEHLRQSGTLKRMKPRAQTVALHLVAIIPSGSGMVRREQLADATGLEARTVQRAIADLESMQVMARSHQRGRACRVTLYKTVQGLERRRP